MRKATLVGLLLLCIVVVAPGVLASVNSYGSLSTFVVVYDPGQLWEHDKSPSEQPGVAAHGRYLIQLYRDGVMKSAGPLEGGGGLVVIMAEDDAAARAIVDADPGVQSGLLTVNMIRRWEPRDWEQFIRR